MRILILCLCLGTALFFGYKTGQKPKTDIVLHKEFPVTTRKTFVFVIYAYNQSLWVDRTLRSIFEQEYDYYRIVFIDDGSKDNTFAAACEFIHENNQESKTLMIRNETKLGLTACLRQVVQSLLDQEIVIPLHAKDWLAHSGALTRMNAIFQNPDVWIASTSGIKYPSFEKRPLGFEGCYAALFKQLPEGSIDLQQVSAGKAIHVSDVLFVANTATPD